MIISVEIKSFYKWTIKKDTAPTLRKFRQCPFLDVLQSKQVNEGNIMLLFFSPLSQFLVKSEKTTKLVFWGVNLIPTPNENKSLEVMGFYYGRLLGYIKHHIDAAIAEMEGSQQPEDKPEPTNSYTEPVAIKIEGDRLDNFTDILESATTGLDFKRSGDTVVVGVFGKEFFGAYGINGNEIWMEYRLTEYLEATHNINFDKLLSGTDIAEITITDGYSAPEPQAEYTPEETEAYDSIFGHQPPSPTPKTEEKIVSDSEPKLIEAGSPKSEIATEPSKTSEVNEVSVSKNDVSFKKPETTDEIFTELKSESLKDRMLECQARQQLEEFKTEIGALKAGEIWNDCTIPEKNLIKCITKTEKKPPATLGYQFTYTAPLTKVKYNALYLGFYLYGEPIEGDDKRVVLVENLPIICDKSDLKPIPVKKQRKLSDDEVQELEFIISNPLEKSDTDTDTAPTATEIANNNFTGLLPAPKSQTQNGSQIGNKPDSELLKPSVAVQPELNLKTAEPKPDPKTEVEPTALLELATQKIKETNNTLTFKYEKRGKNVVVQVFHNESYLCEWEDISNELYPSKVEKLKFFGFTEEQLDRISELELSPKA